MGVGKLIMTNARLSYESCAKCAAKIVLALATACACTAKRCYANVRRLWRVAHAMDRIAIQNW